MTRKYLFNLGPSLLVGLGIIVATLAVKLTAHSGWWVMTGPVVLAASVLCADLLEARLRGKQFSPSFGALIFAGAFIAAGFLLALRDPSFLALFMLFGVVALPSRLGSGRRGCRYIYR